MNKFFAMMVALVATLFVSNAFAWNPPPSPAPASWISDPSHVLSDAAHARLDAKLKQINQSSANEMAALILPTLDGESIEDAGDLTSKAWGVGKKNLDNGVLVVLAMKEHKSRISTGKGVEGDLPDLKCNDILQAMRPYLRSGNVEGALGYAFDQASTLIANHKAEAAAQAAKAKETGGGPPLASNNAPQTSTSNSHSCQVSAPGSDAGGLLWVLILGGGLALGIWYLASRSAARRREEEEIERQAREERTRLRRLNSEREANRRAEEQRLNSPVLPIVHPTPVVRPVAPAPVSTPAVVAVSAVAAGVTAATGMALAAAEEESRRHREAEARRRRLQQEEEDNRKRREQAEEDDRRRRSSESSSSYSSGSSWDSGSSSSGGGWDSGGSGGFGGGDSGGGGSSSDW